MKRASGVLMHISSLWGGYSEGSFGKCAKEWIDFLSDCGFSYWQTLPFLMTDEYNSPYKSFSAFSLNPFFIDLPLLSEQGLLTKEELELNKETTPYLCEFERLWKERLFLLEKACDRFNKWNDVESFLEAHPHTDSFCNFMALKDANDNRHWTLWEKDTYNIKTLKLWQFTQFFAYTQWMEIKKYANSKGIKIIGDVPIYVSDDSSDVWSAPDNFFLDKKGKPQNVAGVPPDYFCDDGQLWGNPLYNWKKMKDDGFSWWKDRIGFMCELFDGVRIDHFRAFESYFSIPAKDKTAKNGKWIKGPGMVLINAIKPVLKDKLIIAEDLGVITPEVRRLVEKSGFPGMSVLQFGFMGDDNSPHLPHNYKNNLVCYTGTHDNNTLLGFLWESDDFTKQKILDYFGFSGHWNECYNSILRTMFQSSAGLVILPVQDLLLYGEDTRFNKPGNALNNWAFRITKEQVGTIDKEKFLNWNKLYARI
ncbi:MAG: 4-alpha-glucanotransferase [Clostridiales bacterium]|nr:4-alpha-glucanotransferase [Clostridiales bacterium]